VEGERRGGEKKGGEGRGKEGAQDYTSPPPPKLISPYALGMGVDTAGVRGLKPPHFEVGVANVFQPPRISCMPLIILFVLTQFFTFVSYHLGRFSILSHS
jgi:hypothetical protein